MEFAVSATGRVKDLTIVEARPVGVFDQAAKQAMQGWKFAVSSASNITRRYRQIMVFSLSGAASDDGNGADATGTSDASSRGGCEMVTGSLICRRPDRSAAFGMNNRRVGRSDH